MSSPGQILFDEYGLDDEYAMDLGLMGEDMDFNNLDPAEPESQMLDPNLTTAYPGPMSIQPSALQRPVGNSVPLASGIVDTIEPNVNLGSGGQVENPSSPQTCVQLVTPPISLSPNGPERNRSQTTASVMSNASRNAKRKRDDEDRKYKNRIAASKCRIKKKEMQRELQKQMDNLNSSNDKLIAQVKALNEERLSLKTEMLEHSHCNNYSIDQWLADSAAGLVNNTGNRPSVSNSHQNSPSGLSTVSTLAQTPFQHRLSIVSARSRLEDSSDIEPPLLGIGSPVLQVPTIASSGASNQSYSHDGGQLMMRIPSQSYSHGGGQLMMRDPSQSYSQDGGQMMMRDPSQSYSQDGGQMMRRSPSSGMDTFYDINGSRAGSQQPVMFGQHIMTSVRDDLGHSRRESSMMASPHVSSTIVVQPVPSGADPLLVSTMLDPRLATGVDVFGAGQRGYSQG